MILAMVIGITLFIGIIITAVIIDADIQTTMALLTIAIITAVIIPAGIGETNKINLGEQIISTENIESVQNENIIGINGKFILGTGKINTYGETTYYYGVQTEYGYKIKSITEKEIYIVEDGLNKIDKIAEVEITEKKWYQFETRTEKNTKYIIHVPKNTIIKEFEVK